MPKIAGLEAICLLFHEGTETSYTFPLCLLRIKAIILPQSDINGLTVPNIESTTVLIFRLKYRASSLLVHNQ